MIKNVSSPAPSFVDVKARVLAEHRLLRGMMARVEERARKVLVDVRAAPALEDAIWELYAAFDEHLTTEEEDLAPWLSLLDSDGSTRVVHMLDEHREQRAVVNALVDESEEDSKAIAEIADDALWFVRCLERDMECEELEIAEIEEAAAARAGAAAPSVG